MKFEEILGQQHVIEYLKIAVEAAEKRDEPLGHILFCGPSGHGKTSLANAVCEALGKEPIVVNGGTVKGIEKLTPYLMRLNQKDVLFIDEIHRLAITTEEFMYTAMEEWYVNIGRGDKNVKLDIPRFTLIGATTQEGDLSEPFLNRFKHILTLRHYNIDEVASIVVDYVKNKLGLSIDNDAARAIASGSRLVPRVAKHYAEWARDIATKYGIKKINKQIALKALEMKGIDSDGLTTDDHRYLDVLRNNWPFSVGLNALSKELQIDATTIENVIEPHLLRKKLITRTSSGRLINDR